MKGLRFSLSLLLLFPLVSSLSISGVDNVSKIYPRKALFGLGNKKDKVALSHVSCSFSPAVTSIVGPSGSGKSTFTKAIIGLESLEEGNVNRTPPDSAYAFVDHLIRSSYDGEKSPDDYISEQDAPALRKALESFRITLDAPVSNLLESQRKTFEILLALARTKEQGPYLVVLDEYLDKDIKSVRAQIYKNLLLLCKDENVKLQVLIITHSKSTFLECSDYTVVIHNGRLYDEGIPSKVRYPSQMAWLA